MKKNNEIVAVVAPAIKIQFWKEIYMTLSKGKVPFHLVFVGHVRPSFNLPPNFTYIHCSSGAGMCIEIGYRYVYENLKNAKFVVNIADDLILSEMFLEELIFFYNLQQSKYPDRLVVVGPICLMQSGEENLMAIHDGGPTLLTPAFTTIENSRKIGGVDKRFSGIYWDCDRALRVHQKEGMVIFASCDEMTPVVEREHNPGLYVRYSHVDRPFLDSLWEYTSDSSKNTACGSYSKYDPEYEAKYGRKRNELTYKKLAVQRKDEVQEYTNEELKEYI